MFALDSTAPVAAMRCILASQQSKHLALSRHASHASATARRAAKVSTAALAEQESTLTFLQDLGFFTHETSVCREFHRRVEAAAQLQLAKLVTGSTSEVLAAPSNLSTLAELGPAVSRDVLCSKLPLEMPHSWQELARGAVSASFAAEPFSSPTRPAASLLRAWLWAKVSYSGVGLNIQRVRPGPSKQVAVWILLAFYEPICFGPCFPGGTICHGNAGKKKDRKRGEQREKNAREHCVHIHTHPH